MLTPRLEGSVAPTPVPPPVIVREFLRASDLNLSLLFQYPPRSYTDVVIIRKRGANQSLQLRLAKNLGPLLIGDGILGIADNRSIVGAAKRRRSGNGWTIVPRANIASGDK